MWIEFVEWYEQTAHFSLGIDYDTACEIADKGSLEDCHKDQIFAAFLEAVAKTR